jgi:hypothetical protein
MFQTKVLEKIKTHILCSLTFKTKYCLRRMGFPFGFLGTIQYWWLKSVRCVVSLVGAGGNAIKGFGSELYVKRLM